MTLSSSPKVAHARSIPLVWIVPLLALAIGGWMIFQDWRQRGPAIVIDFKDGSGVEKGKTVLDYKGVSVGTVQRVELKADLHTVAVHLQLEKNAAPLAVEGSSFWIVHPEIGFSGIKGLDTLITGARLGVRPGAGKPTAHFTGLEKAPLPEPTADGRMFVLRSDRLGSLSTGSPVFYREMKVGIVETSRLSSDSTAVLIKIYIDAPYIDLVRTNSRFWNAGGFSFKIGLLGATLKNTSLESLLTGSVAFATPDGDPLAEPAPAGAEFALTADADKEWLKWHPKIPINSPESTNPAPHGDALPGLVKP